MSQIRGSGHYDQMIAGHARSLGLIVVASNISDFARVEGLRVENWVAACSARSRPIMLVIKKPVRWVETDIEGYGFSLAGHSSATITAIMPPIAKAKAINRKSRRCSNLFP